MNRVTATFRRPMPERRWAVSLSADPVLVPSGLHAKAQQHALQNRPWGPGCRCWTYRGAARKARRWNSLRSSAAMPGSFEVYGPDGKGTDQ